MNYEEVKVLDKGFVRLVDTMGDDAAIVQAARTSYGKGTTTVSEDRGLIRYLMRSRHTTPFEMCEIKLHIKIPMDCWRQMIRHRTANVNEYSTRYSEAIDERQETLPGEWRLQATSNKQGSDGLLPEKEGLLLTLGEQELHRDSTREYQNRLAKGNAREQARKDLTLSTYTMAYWKVDLHNLFHFLGLRLDSHAQQEIRAYAQAIADLVKAWVPLAWEAFEDYRMNAMFLSRLDIQMIETLSMPDQASFDLAMDFGWCEYNAAGKLKKNRERSDFNVKVRRLGLEPPNWKAAK